jgi:hypothetical protein
VPTRWGDVLSKTVRKRGFRPFSALIGRGRNPKSKKKG